MKNKLPNKQQSIQAISSSNNNNNNNNNNKNNKCNRKIPGHWVLQNLTTDNYLYDKYSSINKAKTIKPINISQVNKQEFNYFSYTYLSNFLEEENNCSRSIDNYDWIPNFDCKLHLRNPKTAAQLLSNKKIAFIGNNNNNNNNIITTVLL